MTDYIEVGTRWNLMDSDPDGDWSNEDYILTAYRPNGVSSTEYVVNLVGIDCGNRWAVPVTVEEDPLTRKPAITEELFRKICSDNDARPANSGFVEIVQSERYFGSYWSLGSDQFVLTQLHVESRPSEAVKTVGLVSLKTGKVFGHTVTFNRVWRVGEMDVPTDELWVELTGGCDFVRVR